MKKVIASVLLVGALMSGCTSETRYGSCVGISGDAKDEHLKYEVSIWNAVLAVVFSETVIVPVWVIAKDIECPVGSK